MGNEQERCLAAEEILEYLDGGLSEGRWGEVERHLDECRLCGSAVEGVAKLEWRDGFLRSADKVRGQVRARTASAVVAASARRRKVLHFRPRPQYLALAATVIVGVGAAFLLTRPGPGEALFQSYFEPYPSTQPVLRSADGGPPRGLSLYEARDYSGALAAFEADLGSEREDPEILFYAGVSRLALGRAREATLDLERVLSLGDRDLREPAEWYLALAHLRGPDPTQARTYLERIAEGDGFYRAKARELLSELEPLDRGR